MPLLITIDANDYINESALSEEEISSFHNLLLLRLEKAFGEQWQNQVNENLHSTQREYEYAMFTDHPNDNTVVMGVTARKSQLAVNLELGIGPFDEKIGFEQGARSGPQTKGRGLKKNGKGWFITIPFRAAVSTALAESLAFTNIMPDVIYAKVEQASKPLSFSQLPAGFQGKGIRPTIQSSGRTFPAYQHKTARYEGLVRILDKDEGRGGYFTFRRVSDKNMGDNSWIHPGLAARGLLKKALDKTDVDKVVRGAKIDFFKNTT